MGIALGSSFTRQASVPLDEYDVVADNTARDALLAGVRYEGMTVFSIASNKSYQLQGGITNGDWIEGGGGGGGYVIGALQSIAALGTIAVNLNVQQFTKVEGALGPQVTANAPFTSAPTDGTIITLYGTHAVNILQIPYADIAEGCLLKGNCYLSIGDTLTLLYDLAAQRYYEISRN